MREFHEFQDKGMAAAAKGKGAKFNMDEPEPRFRLSAKVKSDIEDFVWFVVCFFAIIVFFWTVY